MLKLSCMRSYPNGQMLRPYTVSQVSLLLEFFKKLKCYDFSCLVEMAEDKLVIYVRL